MEMSKDLASYIVDLADVNVHEIGDRTYTDKKLYPVEEPTIKCLEVHTLKALADYINAEPDANHVSSNFVVHILDYNQVCIYEGVNYDMVRNPILVAKLNDISPSFGNWYGMEEFNIVLQSRFVQTETSKQLLKMVGNIADTHVKDVGDDGITQQVTVKTGVAMRANEVVPNPIRLTPYRTFVELSQPEGDFVFRLNNSRDERIVAALFEADGGAWKNNAIASIHNYLAEKITAKKLAGITILG